MPFLTGMFQSSNTASGMVFLTRIQGLLTVFCLYDAEIQGLEDLSGHKAGQPSNRQPPNMTSSHFSITGCRSGPIRKCPTSRQAAISRP